MRKVYKLYPENLGLFEKILILLTMIIIGVVLAAAMIVIAGTAALIVLEIVLSLYT